MNVNVGKFKEKLYNSGISQKELAKMIGISENNLSLKVNGKTRLFTDEVIKMCEILGIEDDEERSKIFLRKTSQ